MLKWTLHDVFQYYSPLDYTADSIYSLSLEGLQYTTWKDTQYRPHNNNTVKLQLKIR